MHLGLQDGELTVLVSASSERLMRPGPLSQGSGHLGGDTVAQEVSEWEPPLGHKGDLWILCTIHVPLRGPQ